MRLCEPHFAELRGHLVRAGLGHYSSPSHRAAVDRYDRDGYLESGPLTLERFDGVLVSYDIILGKAEEAAGRDYDRYQAVALNAICPACSFADKARREEWLLEGVVMATAFHDRLIGGHA